MARSPADRARPDPLRDRAQDPRASARSSARSSALETGKPAFQAPIRDRGRGAVLRALRRPRERDRTGETIDLGAGYHSYTRREPFGVVGVILPWNAPLNQAARAIAPALAAGNTVVAKPSEFTSASLLELARIAVEECGLPPGRSQRGHRHGRGGRRGAGAAPRRPQGRVHRLGARRDARSARSPPSASSRSRSSSAGSPPNIVFADADLKQAVPGSLCAPSSSTRARSARRHAHPGRAVDPRRVRRRHGAGARGVSRRRRRQGHDRPDDHRGAVREGAASTTRSRREEGAVAAAGGALPTDPELREGWFVSPTIYTGVKQRHAHRARGDFRAGRLRDAVRRRGRGDPHRQRHRLRPRCRDLDARPRRARIASRRGSRRARCYVNEWLAGGVETPLGGYKMSGYGREKGIEALHHYTQVKCVTIKL